MTLKIHRSASDEVVIFALSGELNEDHAATLRALLSSEANVRVLLDLKDVTLVDREAVRFLSRVEAAGIDLVNCPEYVRSWIAAEQDAT